MPDMLGTQVAAQIRQHRPSLPVLYMSGYAQPVLDSPGPGYREGAAMPCW
jgi:CheY-like chemotaxis protein